MSVTRLEHTLEGRADTVWAVAVTPDGQRIISARRVIQLVSNDR